MNWSSLHGTRDEKPPMAGDPGTNGSSLPGPPRTTSRTRSLLRLLTGALSHDLKGGESSSSWGAAPAGRAEPAECYACSGIPPDGINGRPPYMDSSTALGALGIPPSPADGFGEVRQRGAPHGAMCRNSSTCSSSGLLRGGEEGGKEQGPPQRWWFGTVLTPHSRRVKLWNRLFLLSLVMLVAVDPLFFYLMSLNVDYLCFYEQGWFLLTVTLLRCIADAIYISHMWLQLRLAYVSRTSLRIGRGDLVTDPRAVAMHYLRCKGGFFADVFVILPIPQLTVWVFIPALLASGRPTSLASSSLLLLLLLQYIPKLVRAISLVQQMTRATGYVFGTAWWGFALNLAAYLTASHFAGATWYLLGTKRLESCLLDQCSIMPGCQPSLLGCPDPIAFSMSQPDAGPGNIAWGANSTAASACIAPNSSYRFGIYAAAVPLITDPFVLEKLLYPIFWGIMSLSSFGNALTPSNELSETIFCILVIVSGLLLFVLLIGNIQVFLQSLNVRVEAMRRRRRDLEWWMRRRQLPTYLKQRVRGYERHRWAATRGINEDEMVAQLPEGLQRDVKRHVSLDLVKKVPLFEHMDSLLLDNICERLKPVLLTGGTQVVRESEPVSRMLFVIRGHIRATHHTGDRLSSCILGTGGFTGEELLTWCLDKRATRDRLPLSSATIEAVDVVEAFALDAADLMYVTTHFPQRLKTRRLRHAIRHYSPHWRTWAAVTIQLAWRRHQALKVAGLDSRLSKMPSYLGQPAPTVPEERPDVRKRLRMYTALFMSPKPSE